MTDRSFEPIHREDLVRLAAIARADRDELFHRNPGLGSAYRDRVLIVALCQGAALHYLNGRAGVKDFDVWTFFSTNPSRQFPARRNVHRDFGDPRFGVSTDWPDFRGRCVDLIGRSILWRRGQTAVEAVQNYLRTSKADSPRLLAQKAVVVLEPEDKLGTIIWPLSGGGDGQC
jgi:hypothetical protein